MYFSTFQMPGMSNELRMNHLMSPGWNCVLVDLVDAKFCVWRLFFRKRERSDTISTYLAELSADVECTIFWHHHMNAVVLRRFNSIVKQSRRFLTICIRRQWDTCHKTFNNSYFLRSCYHWKHFSMEFPSSLVGPVDGFIEFVYSFGPLAEKTLILGEFMQEKCVTCCRHCLVDVLIFWYMILLDVPTISSWRFEGPGRCRCRWSRDGHRKCIVRSWNACLLSSRFHHGAASFWNDETHLFISSRSFPPPIYFGSPMDPSFD